MTEKYIERAWTSFHYHDKLPRKAKKMILGTRISGNKLRQMLAEVRVIPATSRNDTIVEPFGFCPSCGCDIVRYIDHGVAYPERWVSGYCGRCGKKVVESDNSPYIHILEEIKC